MASSTLERAALWTWPALFLLLVVVYLWPPTEALVLPVRERQSVQDVVRYATKLCWTWRSVKTRARVSDGMDAKLHVGAQAFDATIYDPDTEEAWNSSQALPVSPEPQLQRYCTTLPPRSAGKPVRLTQTAYYPSLVPWLHVQLRLPDVVAP